MDVDFRPEIRSDLSTKNLISSDDPFEKIFKFIQAEAKGKSIGTGTVTCLSMKVAREFGLKTRSGRYPEWVRGLVLMAFRKGIRRGMIFSNGSDFQDKLKLRKQSQKVR